MPPPIPGALRCEHDKPLIAVNTLCYPNTYSELIIKCIDTNGLCPGFTLLSIRVALCAGGAGPGVNPVECSCLCI